MNEALAGLNSHALPVRWVDRDSLHLTVKFLGEVPDQNLPAVRNALQRGVSGRRVFDVALHGLGAFPSLGRPSILWVGISGPPALGILQQSIEAEFQEIGFEPETRPFNAHVTVARVRKSAQIRDRALMDRIVADFRYKTEFAVTSADLMRSHLGPRGARYEVVARMELN